MGEQFATNVAMYFFSYGVLIWNFPETAQWPD